jgi:HAD superfamily hydrolase (TIGR01484 family)
MQPLKEAAGQDFAGVRFVLTDMDDTLTFQGRLSARTYQALERLQAAGVVVIPVTAAPAGWCDQMARMWPIDGVIGENGGLFIRRDGEHGVRRTCWSADPESDREQLARIAERVRAVEPAAVLADDQAFRLASLAFQAPGDDGLNRRIMAELRSQGLSTTRNNLWLLGWRGAFDKLSMARRVLAEAYGVDIDADRDGIVYVGDSTNDAPMFSHFPRSVGVSTVRRFLADIPQPPAWITEGPGGDGFVEVADAVIAASAG